MGLFKKKFRNIKKLPNWVYIFPEMLLRSWLFTCRVKIHDPNNTITDPTPVVGLLWHNRLIFFPLLFPLESRKRTTAVISPSRDGQYIADFAGRLGVRALRGSSNKRGASVQREAIHELGNGCHVIFTPDGPRGPKYKLSRGPIHLAMTTGAPIVPLMVNASRYWQLKSWDNFQLPKPFCRIDLVVGEKISVLPNLSEAEQEAVRVRAERALNEITVDKICNN